MISQLLNFLGVIGVVLTAALLFLLVPKGVRKFPILFIYAAARLLADISEMYGFHQFGRSTNQYAKLYWTGETILALLMFLMVILFTYQALEGLPMRPQVGRFLAGVAVIAIAAPLLIYHQRVLFSTRWFNGVIQWAQFGAAIMNLGLWTALLANKKRDPQLLAVSIGLGVMATGAAVYLGLRQFTTARMETRNLANLVGPLTHLLGMFVWCWAFRPAARPEAAPRPKPEPGPAATSSGY